jgi:hypothetical protein
MTFVAACQIWSGILRWSRWVNARSAIRRRPRIRATPSATAGKERERIALSTEVFRSDLLGPIKELLSLSRRINHSFENFHVDVCQLIDIEASLPHLMFSQFLQRFRVRLKVSDKIYR